MSFEKLGWCDEARSALARTFGEGGPEWIGGEVDSGRCELWRIDGGRVWLITRALAGGLVIECLQGRGLLRLAPLLYRIAQRNGMRYVEFLTRRVGLPRMLGEYGCSLHMSTDYGNIYRCTVHHEQ